MKGLEKGSRIQSQNQQEAEREAAKHRKMLEFPTLDLSPFDRFGLTPLDDAIRHGHVPVQKLLKHEGAQMGKVEFGVALCEAASQNDHNKIRQMIEAGVRAGMADYDYRYPVEIRQDLLERLARFRTEVEEEAHLYTTCANNIRYDLCRILHASVLLNDETASSGAEKLHKQIMLEEGATIQRLRFLMEKDLKTLDSSTVKILEHVDNELMPWLNSLRSNTHTKGLLPLLLPNIFQDMEQLLSVLRHIKALLPQLLTKVSTGTTSVGASDATTAAACFRGCSSMPKHGPWHGTWPTNERNESNG
eukprot:Skav219978  [mRNA]  locus=scaffold137:16133:21331:- [translate_table: standard]